MSNDDKNIQRKIARSQLRKGAHLDVRRELDKFENLLAELKIQYEQHFLGILPLAPDSLHADVKRQKRLIMSLPFKNSAVNFRFRALENRYQSYYTYWQRVQKQREEGTYSKDVFKAAMREASLLEEEKNRNLKSSDRSLIALFDAYKNAIEKQSGARQQLDFDTFKKSLMTRAKKFKEQNAGKKLKFRVVVKDGKVSVQGIAK